MDIRKLIYANLILLALQTITPTSVIAAPLKVIFCSDTDGNAVPGYLQRVDLDGTNLATIRSSNTTSIRGCSYDPSTDKIFFSEGSQLITTTIANSPSTTLQSPGGTLTGMAIDPSTSKMYWSDPDNDAIKFASSTTASASVATLVSGADFADTRDIEIDSINSFLYAVSFSSDVGSWQITRIRLINPAVSTVVTGLNSPNGVAVDAAHNRLFYTDAGTSKIWKVDLDGTNSVDLTATVGGVVNPQDIDYDPETNKIYWLDNGTSIKSANPDGSSAQTIVAGLDRVVYLTLYNPDLVTLTPTLTNPQAGNTYVTNLPITFTLGETGLTGSTNITFRQGMSSIASLTMTDATSVNTTIEPFASSVSMNAAVVSASGFPIAEGTYDVSLSYQDALGNGPATVTNAGVVLALPTSTPTSTPTLTPTNTPTVTPTSTPTESPTETPTPVATATATAAPTPTPRPQLKAPTLAKKGNLVTIQIPAYRATSKFSNWV